MEIAYAKLNHKYELTECNSFFINYLNTKIDYSLIGLSIFEIISQTKLEPLSQYLHNSNKQDSFLAFTQHSLNKTSLVGIEYISTTKTSDVVTIKIVNWLNWLSKLNNSIENSYHTIAKMSQESYNDKIKVASEAHWFKALFPLLTHIPNQLVSMIGSWAYFDILKLFTAKRGENKYSKDYNRDTLSRVKNSMKKHTGLDNIEILHILNNNSLHKSPYTDHIYIPHTILKNNFLITIKEDRLLENLLKIL